jgi:GrpB-like predicted nucleotidyltransferase (UPF0157 family)
VNAVEENAILGLPSGTVALAPYTPEWARLFEEERARLQDALGDLALDIQHVGSTSVPGMAAKPILDIAIAVREFEAARACISPMERLGFTFRGELGIPRRHYFVKGALHSRHVHMLEATSESWRTMVLFRDWLLLHPETREEYAHLKQCLAKRFPLDRTAYTNGKHTFIQGVLQRAKLCSNGSLGG